MTLKVAENRLLGATLAILAGFYLIINFHVDFKAPSIAEKDLFLEVLGIISLFVGVYFLYKTFKRSV
jgi:hypothetical protein